MRRFDTRSAQRDARHLAAGDGRYCGLGDLHEHVIEAVGVVKLLGNVGEHHREARRWGVGLPPLPRFLSIGSCYRLFRPRLVSVLSRLRPSGMGLGPLCRRSRLLSGTAKLRGAGVQLPFPLLELRLPVVGSPVPGVGHPVSLISHLISPVSNEIALVGGPRALLVA